MSKTLRLGWTALATLMSALALFAAIVTETEPNNTPAAAQPVVLGDTMQGIISADTDVDYFKYTLSEGTYIFKVMYPEGDPLPGLDRGDRCQWQRISACLLLTTALI